MDNDRTVICQIISEMLDNPDSHGIYPTSEAYERLERYIEGVRMEALGWCHMEHCVTLDNGGDPRKTEIPDILERVKVDLSSGELQKKFINESF